MPMTMNILGYFTLWRTLKAVAILALTWVVFSVTLEAYALSRAFVWVKEGILKLAWKPPERPYDHYCVEILKTSLLEEPVTTRVSYAYTKEGDYQIELQADHSYMFRVQSVSTYGMRSAFSDSSALFVLSKGAASKGSSTDRLPMAFSLSQNYPNPFNSQTTIAYGIPSDVRGGTRVQLIIYNMLGQQVRKLVSETQVPGEYKITWDRRDESGRQVTSGHYLYQLTAGIYSASKKMIYMK